MEEWVRERVREGLSEGYGEEGREKEERGYFDHFRQWTLKWWLMGVLYTMFCPNFGRVSSCAAKNSKHKTVKDAQSHFGTPCIQI